MEIYIETKGLFKYHKKLLQIKNYELLIRNIEKIDNIDEEQALS